MIINTKSDLDALRGTDAYADALRCILGATTTWVNDGPYSDTPVWRLRDCGDALARFGLSRAELMAACEESGVVQQAPTAPAAGPASSVDLVAYTMARRDELIDGGVTFGGVAYQTRPTDRENILGASLLASLALAGGAQAGDFRWADPAADFVWIAMDNSKVQMDAPTVIELGKAQAARKQGLIFKARWIKDQIAAGLITTKAEIDAAFG